MATSKIPNVGEIKSNAVITATQADYETVATVTMPSWGIIAFKPSYWSSRPTGIRLIRTVNGQIVAVDEDETEYYRLSLCEAVVDGEYALQVKTASFAAGHKKQIYYIAIY